MLLCAHSDRETDPRRGARRRHVEAVEHEPAARECVEIRRANLAAEGGQVRVAAEVVRDVEAGSERASEAGTALTRILESAADVNGEIVKITDASGLMQSSATELATIVEQVAAVASKLNELAGEMQSGSERATTSCASGSFIL